MVKEQKIKALIIDDEPDAVEQLQKMLQEHESIEVTGSLSSATNAAQVINKTKPDVLFLDIQMPDKSGLDLLKELSEIENPPVVVMVTAFGDYMLDAFRNSAFDYLLKPIDRIELQNCVERIRKNGFQRPSNKEFKQFFASIPEKVCIPGLYETIFLNTDEVFYFQADGRYTDIYLTTGKTVKTSANLGKLIKSFNDNSFVRISRSCIINTHYLFKQDHRNKTITLQHNERTKELACSKRYLQ